MLVLRTKDPALSDLDNKIQAMHREYKKYLIKAETDPLYLKNAESALEDMNALLDLRSRGANKRKTQETS